MGPLDRARLEALVAGFAELELLVAGDVMLDEYLWGEVDRVSPEAPVVVVHVRDESLALGGAGNVVRNVVALGARCRFCGVVGDDEAGRQVAALLGELGVDAGGLAVDPNRPTTRKTRVVARSQQLVRFDRERDVSVSGHASEALLASLRDGARSSAGAVFADYAKGALSAELIRKAMALLGRLPVFVDPKSEVDAYRGARLVKPNLRELESLTGTRIRDDRALSAAAGQLRERCGGADVVVTRGSEGMTLFEGERDGVDVHTAAREVFDVQGAGDTTIAALALARLAGASLLEAAVVANAAAGVVLGKIGTATAEPDEVCALLPQAIRAAGAGA